MCQHNSPNFVSLKFKPPDTYFISADRLEKLRSSCNFAIICPERCSNVKVIKDYPRLKVMSGSSLDFFLRPPGASKIDFIKKKLRKMLCFVN